MHLLAILVPPSPPNSIDLLTCLLIALLDVDQEKCILLSPRENLADQNVQCTLKVLIDFCPV